MIRAARPPEEAEPALKVGRSGLRAFRWGWTIFVVAATSVPYLVNWLLTPAGFHYTWILPPYPEDSFAYMAWSQQAAHGSLLFQLKYTALPHAPFLFHPFFLICGWMSWLLACDIGIVHWGFKAAGVVVFFLAFFKYTDQLGLGSFQSIVASILAGLTSGVGGLLAFLGVANRLPVYPADLWLVDVNTYWSLLWNPLFPYSLALMLLAMCWLDRGTRDARKSDMWLSGLATGVLALIHPYSQPLLFTLAAIITIVRRRAETPGYLARYFAAALPFVLYGVLVSVFHPLVARHNLQGEMRSPPLQAYAMGFGLPLLLCLAGAAIGRGTWIKRRWPVLLWFVAAMAFSYLPLWFQGKLVFGAHLPLCVLAASAFDLILARWTGPRARQRALAAAAVISLPLLASTPVYLLASEGKAVKENAGGAYYLSDDLMAGLRFLKHQTKPNDVVLATPATSRLIPAFSGNTVVWGHWAMSVDRKDRQDWFAQLFSPRSNWDDDRRSREFWGTGIQYVFFDGELRRSLEQTPEAWRAILGDADKVFANGSVVIYRHRAG